MKVAAIEEIDHDGIVSCGIHDDSAFESDRIHITVRGWIANTRAADIVAVGMTRLDRAELLACRRRSEPNRHILALESDSGAFAPRGFSVQADSLIVAEVARLAAPLARVVIDEPSEWNVAKGGSGVDIGPIVREGVPGVGHRVEHSRYFDVHHSLADTFEKIDPDHLARNVAAIAGLIYQVADSPASLRSESSDGGS